MGHVSATGATTDEALRHARDAAALMQWEGAADHDDQDGSS
jgi:hypothetical protein